jgi:hypothetical protein
MKAAVDNEFPESLKFFFFMPASEVVYYIFI